MVYDVSTSGQNKQARTKAEGKLIGMQSDSSKCKVFDPEEGKYSWIRLSIVTGQDEEGNDEFLNVTAYDVDFNKMPELKKADELIRDKKKPWVELEYYTSKKAQVGEDGQPIMVEEEEERKGKTVVVQKPQVWINHRMSKDDVINSFKIVKEAAEEIETADQISEETVE